MFCSHMLYFCIIPKCLHSCSLKHNRVVLKLKLGHTFLKVSLWGAPKHWSTLVERYKYSKSCTPALENLFMWMQPEGFVAFAPRGDTKTGWLQAKKAIICLHTATCHASSACALQLLLAQLCLDILRQRQKSTLQQKDYQAKFWPCEV